MRFLVILGLVGVVAATACRVEPPSSGPANAEGTRVFLEAVLLAAPVDDASLTEGLDRLAARTDGTVLAAPHVLLPEARSTPVEFGVGADSPADSVWWFEPLVSDDDRISLEVEHRDPSLPVHTTVLLTNGETVVLALATAASTTLVLRAEVVHDQDDLQRILARKVAAARSNPGPAGTR
jgi:hypothetical protein